MTVIRVRCSDCDEELRVKPTEVDVVQYGAEVWYSFACTCGSYCSRLADQEAVSLLAMAGLKPRAAIPSPRPMIRGRTPVGPRLTEGDLFDLRLDLAVVVDPLAELTS